MPVLWNSLHAHIALPSHQQPLVVFSINGCHYHQYCVFDAARCLQHSASQLHLTSGKMTAKEKEEMKTGGSEQ